MFLVGRMFLKIVVEIVKRLELKEYFDRIKGSTICATVSVDWSASVPLAPFASAAQQAEFHAGN